MEALHHQHRVKENANVANDIMIHAFGSWTMSQEEWGEERPITYGAGGEGEENTARQWRVYEGQILVSHPAPIWRVTCFLCAGILPGFLASGQQGGFGH